MMRNTLIIGFGFFICMSVSFTASAQHISGTVTDAQTGKPIPGVNILVVGTSTGTATNDQGHYSLNVSSLQDTLRFSFIGYKTKMVSIDSRNTIDISLQPTIFKGNQLVVTGYQTQRKLSVTGAVSIVDTKDIKNVPVTNMMKALQGRVPGLYITRNGAPSGVTSTVVIRGFNTLGSNAPLYVIDGVSTTNPAIFNSLDPNVIKSVQILKNASAESIYGSRASNGVVIVQTKRGTKGKLKIHFSSSATVENYATRVPVLTSKQLGRAIWQAAINDGVNPNKKTTLFSYTQHKGSNGHPVLDKVKVRPFLGDSKLEPSANTDWQSVVYHPGVITSNSLTLSSGSEHSSVLLNLNYKNNTGMLESNKGYRRYGARLNTAFNEFNDKLTIGNNVDFFNSSYVPVLTDLGGASVEYLAIFENPLIPVYTKNGKFAGPLGSGFSDRDNPLGVLHRSRWNRNNELSIFGNLSAEIKPVKNLNIKTNFGYSYDKTYVKRIKPKFEEGFISRVNNQLSINQNRGINFDWINTINYKLSTGSNSIKFLLGTEAITHRLRTLQASKKGFAIQNKNYFQLSAGTGVTTNTGSTTGYQLLSFFGKINYSFNTKYLASVTLRRDGSSRFGINNRFGWFPSASVGWRISKENFLKDSNWLSNLKLRFGFGVTGNQVIGNEARFAIYKPNYGTTGEPGEFKNFPDGANNGTAYDISGAGTGILPSGYASVQAANPNIKWESTAGYDAGVDFSFLNNKLSGSFDVFFRNTKNILVQPPYAGILGGGKTKWVNGATKYNKGWELDLGYQSHIGPFSYSINGNLFSFHDEITFLPPTVINAYPGDVQHTILGHSAFSMFGYVVQGIYQNQKEVENHATQTGAGLGRLMYKDLNHNGKIDALDQTWIGVQLPNLNYGLQINLGYNNFSLSLFLQGVQGIEVNNVNKANTDFVGLNPGVNLGKRVLKAWTPQNPHSSIPALSLVDNNNEGRFSTYFVENGSYMKLRNIKLGYNLSNKISGIDQLQVFLMGENLLMLKPHGPDEFTGVDPENPLNSYPIPRKVTIGINLTF